MIDTTRPRLLRSDHDEGEADAEMEIRHEDYGFPDGAIDSCEFVAFDLETTGRHPVWASIIEIAAVRFRCDGREVARFQTLVDPGTPIPIAATEIHGISDDMVRKQPSVADALCRFVEYLGSDPIVLMAHNASFDRAFISGAAANAGQFLPKFPLIDTLAMSRIAFPNAPNHRLPTLLHLLGRSCPGAHRAAYDADGVRHLFERIVAQRSIRSLRDLYEYGAVLPLRDESDIRADIPLGFEDLAAAIEGRLGIQIIYRKGIQTSMLVVVPLQIIASNGKYYLSAICSLAGKPKTYRLDRIQKLRVLHQSARS